MSIFSKHIRTNNLPKIRKQSAFEFLDDSAWPIATYMRNIVSNWLEQFDYDNEFISKLKSKDNKQHYAAMFELLVYRIILNSDRGIEKHPITKTNKLPDYKLTGKGKNEDIYIECTLSSNSFTNAKEKSKSESIEEIIDSLEYFPYWIGIDIKCDSDRSLAKKKLISWITRTISSPEFMIVDNGQPIKADFSIDNWEIEFTFIKKGDKSIRKSLGFIMGGVKPIDSAKPILTALKDKAPSKYGIDGNPYVICLSTDDLFTKEECYFKALFGQSDPTRIYKEPNTNGFLLQNNIPVNTSVSAVVIFRNFDLFTLDTCSISVWHNPFAKNPIKHGLFPFTEYQYENCDNELKRKTILKDEDIFNILKIDKTEYNVLMLKHKTIVED